MVNYLNRRIVKNMRSDNIHNKDNINLHQMLVKAHDEDAAK